MLFVMQFPGNSTLGAGHAVQSLCDRAKVRTLVENANTLGFIDKVFK